MPALEPRNVRYRCIDLKPEPWRAFNKTSVNKKGETPEPGKCFVTIIKHPLVWVGARVDIFRQRRNCSAQTQQDRSNAQERYANDTNAT